MIPRTRVATHPGKILKVDYVEYLGLDQKKFAEHLGISRKHLNNILNEKAALTPEMAVKLGAALDTSAEYWMNLQKNHELSKVQMETNSSKLPKILPELKGVMGA